MRSTGVLVLCAVVCAGVVSCGRGAGQEPAAKKDGAALRREDPWYELAAEVGSQNERILTDRLALAGRRDLLPRLRQEFAFFGSDQDRLYAFAQHARAELGIKAGSSPTREQLDDYIRAQSAKAEALDLRLLEHALLGTGRTLDRPCPPFCK